MPERKTKVYPRRDDRVQQKVWIKPAAKAELVRRAAAGRVTMSEVVEDWLSGRGDA